MIHWSDPDVRVNINTPSRNKWSGGVVKRWQCGKYWWEEIALYQRDVSRGLRRSFLLPLIFSTWSREQWAKNTVRRGDEVNRRNVNVHFFSLVCRFWESNKRKKNRLICLFGFGWFCTVISAHEKWNTGGERDGGRKKRKNEVYVNIEHIFWDMRELTVSSEMRDVCVHSFLFFWRVRESSLN
jgi:hypothetical protein